MKKKLRKVVCVILAICCVLTAPAFAKDIDPTVDQPVTNRQSVGSLIASNAGSISGGFGTLNVYLASGNWWADFMAGTANTGVSGSVMCSVRDPDGNVQYLGTISASNGHTSYEEFTYAKAGTYIFIFEANTTSTIEVYGHIFD